MKKRKGSSLVIFVFGLSTIFALAGLVVDVGIILNCQNELQKSAESAALVAASQLEPQLNSDSTVSVDMTTIDTLITDTFNKMIANNPLIKNANFTYDIRHSSKAVRISASADIQTYFMKFIGINQVPVTVKTAAMSAPQYLSKKFPAPSGSVDTANTSLRQPIGGNFNQNWNTATSKWEYTNIFGYPDNKAISLGAGGYLTITLPAPLIDNKGSDLFIKQVGNTKGYFVFAGNDDPVSGQIQWINISCTGIPIGADQTSTVGAYFTSIPGFSKMAKFYGTGYFDLGARCEDSVGTTYYNADLKSAKYIKIIDDNVEDGFIAGFANQPSVLAGDHSSITPGANIDSVALLHHTMLIGFYDLDPDPDGDGLINVLEDIIGTNKNLMDTDGDMIADPSEYLGWYYSGASKLSIINGPSTAVYHTNPLINENATPGVILVK
jgi:Flp pilus assembly protein TadG